METSPYVSPRRDKKEIRKVIRRKEEEENADELNTKFSDLNFKICVADSVEGCHLYLRSNGVKDA